MFVSVCAYNLLIGPNTFIRIPPFSVRRAPPAAFSDACLWSCPLAPAPLRFRAPRHHSQQTWSPKLQKFPAARCVHVPHARLRRGRHAAVHASVGRCAACLAALVCQRVPCVKNSALPRRACTHMPAAGTTGWAGDPGSGRARRFHVDCAVAPGHQPASHHQHWYAAAAWLAPLRRPGWH